ncbi:MAG: LemA family protein [Bacteroidetes bacterium GWB2_41_8]|nr:MAG: LemA family protein [Bacteroidetes bacterium GWB2_41_8]
MNSTLIFVIVIVLILLLVFVSVFNSLTNKKNQVANAFGTIDVQLKNRYDLIPNLVATVQQYATHEKELLTKITELRSKAIQHELTPEDRVNIDNQISTALSGLMVAVENYPDLKASQNFIDLQRSLNEVESQIAAARRAYNAAVTDFNNAIEMFPGNMLAGMMLLKTKQVFTATETERGNVDVKNLFQS